MHDTGPSFERFEFTTSLNASERADRAFGPAI